MSLQLYNKKRNFKKTAEPRGKKVSNRMGKELRFVIQKHDASHLHYDFRLEMEGVLKSWAIPKGPSLDPSQKRLAVRVEDHPIEYGEFEGIIPKGEYGGGTVMLWDTGIWVPDSSPLEGLKKGRLTFELKGEKLRGEWKLFRLKDGKSWLLVKKEDEYARSLSEGDILQTEAQSIKTKRSLEEIASEKKLKKTAKPLAFSAKKQKTPQVSHLVLTNPNKVLWEDADLTKADLARYLAHVSSKMLPYIAERPLMILRCPDGTKKECFFQKHWTQGMHSSIKKFKEGNEELFYIDSAEGILALAQLGALEIHAWNSRIKDIDHPDQFVFDLDPDPNLPWETVVQSAFDLKALLEKYKFNPTVKTTGGKGLHVVAPIEVKIDWKQAKEIAKAFCSELMKKNPDLFLIKMSKAERKGKIFLDYLRNAKGATAVAPYSPRAKNLAAISMPLSWTELKKKSPKSDAFHVTKRAY